MNKQGYKISIKEFLVNYAEKEKELISSMYWQIEKNSTENKLTKYIFKDYLSISENISFKIFEFFDKQKNGFLSHTEFLQAINTGFSRVKTCSESEFLEMIYFLIQPKENNPISFFDIEKFFKNLILDVFNFLTIFNFEYLSLFHNTVVSFMFKELNIEKTNKLFEYKIGLEEFKSRLLAEQPKRLSKLFYFLFILISPIDANLIKNLIWEKKLIFQNDELLVENEIQPNELTPRVNQLPELSVKEINLSKINSYFTSVYESLHYNNKFTTAEKKNFADNVDSKKNIEFDSLRITNDKTTLIKSIDDTIESANIENSLNISDVKNLKSESLKNKLSSLVYNSNNKISNASKHSSFYKSKLSCFDLTKCDNDTTADNTLQLGNKSEILNPEICKASQEFKFYFQNKKEFFKAFEDYKDLTSYLLYLYKILKNFKYIKQSFHTVNKVLFINNSVDLNQKNFLHNESNSCYIYQEENYSTINKEINNNNSRCDNVNNINNNDINNEQVYLHICQLKITKEHIILTKTIKHISNSTAADVSNLLTYCYFFKLKNIFFDLILNANVDDSKRQENLIVNGVSRAFYYISFKNLSQTYRIYFEFDSEYKILFENLQGFVATNFNFSAFNLKENYFSSLINTSAYEKVWRKNSFMQTHEILDYQLNKSIMIQIFRKEILKEVHISYFRKIWDLLRINNYLEFDLFPIKNYFENNEFIFIEYADMNTCKIQYSKESEQFSIAYNKNLISNRKKISENIHKFRKLITFSNEKIFFKELLELIQTDGKA